jgi:general secretion pathway protein A
MYERYYGLNERPFDLSPNPRFLFLSNRHREALTHLWYGLTGRPGLTVLTGEAGTGKTTLVRTALLAANGSSAGIVHLSNPTLTRAEFYEYLSAGFGFTADVAGSKTRFLHELEAAIASRAQKGIVLALIVDEAQSLPNELLEEIRLLTNIQDASGRSLAVVLVGQPELSARLNERALRQVKQRVALRCELTPLHVEETAAYIAARVCIAGGNAEGLFTRDAVLAIHEHSKGIPRTISVICDNALVSGFAADLKPVARSLVLEVCRDFHLGNGVGNESHSATKPPVTAPPLPADRAASDERPADAPAKARRPIVSGITRPRRFSFFQGQR